MSLTPEATAGTMDERPQTVMPNPFTGMAGVVQVLLRQLPPALLAPEVGATLLSSARLLAPIRQGGFECRLSGQDTRVDVQQCIQKRDGQQETLRTYLAMEGARSPSWRRLSSLVNAWAGEGSPLSAGVEEIWIELDNNGRQRDPVVFVGLAPTLHGEEAYTVATHALTFLFTQEGERSVLPALRRCFEACPAGARVGHIGVMLGRGVEALRVNVKGLFPHGTLPYLDRVGWDGPLQTFRYLHEELAVVAERATLCLDVNGDVQPTLALECSVASPNGQRLWWDALLNFLMEIGLCTPAKRAAVLRWPGSTAAFQSDTGWPVDLIADSLLRGPNELGLMRRAISHIKVTVQTATRVEAKAYLWFNHEWMSLPQYREWTA
jgi:hypothetical protein